MSGIVLYSSHINVEVRRHAEKIAFQLKTMGQEFTEVDIASDPVEQEKVRQIAGDVKMPKLCCNGKLVGDFEDVWDLIEEGLLGKTLEELRQ